MLARFAPPNRSPVISALPQADALAIDTETTKDWPMRLEKWESTVQKIVDECRHEQKRPDKILKAWRAKLEKEPTLLQPYQIDEIIREVRQRLNNGSR